MPQWNIYQRIDGLWEIVATIDSDTKPITRRDQHAHLAPTCVSSKPFHYDPRLAFPSAHGLGVRGDPERKGLV